MARYLTSVPTPWSPADAFSYMADVRNFAQWDPGVRQVTALHGNVAGPGAAYDVEVRATFTSLVLRYEVIEWEPPRRLVLSAATRTLRSVDEIRVEPGSAPDAGGALVTYDAELDLLGAMRIANPLLGLAFRRIGDRAAAGLRRVLEAPMPEVL
jgi:hypothetical protein